MMMELFNDYGTFTYKILQTKKHPPKNLGTQFAKKPTIIASWPALYGEEIAAEFQSPLVLLVFIGLHTNYLLLLPLS
jgi:hypothetical protein